MIIRLPFLIAVAMTMTAPTTFSATLPTGSLDIKTNPIPGDFIFGITASGGSRRIPATNVVAGIAPLWKTTWGPIVTVESWPLGKTAALSFTFDDAVPWRTNEASILELYGLRGTVAPQVEFLATNYLGTTSNVFWKLGTNGHEVAAHSYYHMTASNACVAGLTNQAYLPANQTSNAFRFLSNMFGFAPRTWVWPYGWNGNECLEFGLAVSNQFVWARDVGNITNYSTYANQNYLGGVDSAIPNRWRLKTGYYLTSGTTNDATVLLHYTNLVKSLSNGYWCPLMFHSTGATNDASTLDVTTNVLHNVAKLATNQSWLWTVPAGRAANYWLERAQSTCSIASVSSTSAVLTVSTALNTNTHREPLSFLLTLPSGWTTNTLATNSAGLLTLSWLSTTQARFTSTPPATITLYCTNATPSGGVDRPTLFDVPTAPALYGSNRVLLAQGGTQLYESQTTMDSIKTFVTNGLTFGTNIANIYTTNTTGVLTPLLFLPFHLATTNGTWNAVAPYQFVTWTNRFNAAPAVLTNGAGGGYYYPGGWFAQSDYTNTACIVLTNLPQLTNTLTVSTWIRYPFYSNGVPYASPTVTSIETYACRYNNTDDATFRLGASNNGFNLVFQAFTASGATNILNGVALASNRVHTDGRWHHVMGVVRTNQLELYLDGTFSATNARAGIGPLDTVTDASVPFTILGNSSAYTNINRGMTMAYLDSIKIWDSALSDDQRRAAYALEAGEFIPPPQLIQVSTNGSVMMERLQLGSSLGPMFEYSNGKPITSSPTGSIAVNTNAAASSNVLWLRVTNAWLALPSLL